MQKGGGGEGVQKACKNAYVINGRPHAFRYICLGNECPPLLIVYRTNLTLGLAFILEIECCVVWNLEVK